MPSWSGKIYASGTLTANDNSGWILLPIFDADALGAISHAFVRMVPADLATDETLDVVMAMAYDSDGNGTVNIHTFTQVDSNNTAENVVMPGEDSAKLLWSDVLTANQSGTPDNAYWPSCHMPGPIAPYWKFTHTLGGTTKSMQYDIYASVVAPG